MRVSPIVSRTLLALAIASLAGCLERKQTGMLNPDGSGKMTLETTIPIPPVQAGAPAPPDALTLAKQSAQQMVQVSRGVDAWKDVSYDKTADGRAHVVGTVYFHDINQLQLDNPLPLAWTRNAQGNYTLSLKADSGQAAPNAPKPTDAEVAAAVSQGKVQFQQARPELQATLAAMKVDASLTLPGHVAAANNLKVDGGNSVSVSFTGPQVMAAMDRLMADDKTLSDTIRAGKAPDEDQDLLLTQLFGKSGGVYATVSGPVQPTFDYAAEMQAAKAGQAAMFQKLGIDPTPPAPPPQAPQPGQPQQPQPGPYVPGQPGR